MRRENNNEEPFGNFFGEPFGGNSSKDDIPNIEVSFNPFMDSINPFSILWDIDKVKKFLIARGYEIITRQNSVGDDIELAVKPEQKVLPIDAEDDNILEVFENDIQDIILGWLLKLGKTNSKK